MEISPIAGIRVLPQPKAPRLETELTAPSDLEALTRMRDDSYTSTVAKATGAEEDEDGEFENDEIDSEDSALYTTSDDDSFEDAPSTGVSFFV